MQNWEEQRELFPTRKKVTPKPPSRPRIRPNLYARLAKFCAGNASLVLVVATFVIAVLVSLASFNFHVDFNSPIEISIDPAMQAANDKLQREFPTIDNLMVVRISASSPATAKAAAQSIVNTLLADSADIAQAFVPGIGDFYDRFGVLYQDSAEIAVRVQHTLQLKPLFQALAVSPNLSGLSALIGQVAEAVKTGRSPQGLEGLFTEVAKTIANLADAKPQPLDWRAVAGLAYENKTTDWAVIVEPRQGRSGQAKIAIASLVQSALEAGDNLKITVENPPEPAPEPVGSTARPIVIFSALAILFLCVVTIFVLQDARRITLFAVPVLVSVIAGFGAASLLMPRVDRAGATLIFAILVPIAAISCCLATALARPRLKAGSSLTATMLAAQDLGSLVMAMTGIVVVIWLSWAAIPVPSLAALAVTVACACMAGLFAILCVVPSLSTLLPQGEPPQPAELFSEQNVMIWQKIRPMLAVLFMAASLFCVVFFSSLHFGSALAGNVTRGVQFLGSDEKSAETAVNDLKTVSEVGSVRWLGTFMPADVAAKQQALKGLAGAFDFASSGATIGPHDPRIDLEIIESNLRIIADEAGTNEALRTSANQFRHSLAVLVNAGGAIELVSVKLERLIFANFAGLPKLSDDLAMLPVPRPADFDMNLRKLFISDAGSWRVEALPKRIIPAKNFIQAVRRVVVGPLGPLVAEQARLDKLQEILARPMAIGLLGSLLIALAYVQKFIEWLIVVIGTLMPMALFAALAVTTDTAIEPLTIPAVIVAMTASVIMALLSVMHMRTPSISLASAFLPVALALAILLPMQLLQISELADFSRIMTVLLVCSVVFNLIVVQQLCAWFSEWRKSRELRLRDLANARSGDEPP